MWSNFPTLQNPQQSSKTLQEALDFRDCFPMSLLEPEENGTAEWVPGGGAERLRGRGVVAGAGHHPGSCDPVANSGKLSLFLPLFHGLSRSLSHPL